MKHIVIGLGQIGTAIRAVVGGDGFDLKGQDANRSEYDVMHVCIPYSATFEQSVAEYVVDFKPKLVIVHSTVPVGTCDTYGWVHSPVRGVHPNLEEGVRTFLKFFGGARAREASRIFEDLGIETFVAEKAAETEAMKLWDTTQYGLNIILEKEIKKYCDEHDLDFDVVYTLANHSYNKGYLALGKPEYQKYILRHKDGPIGGHCVIPNLSLLGGPIANFIDERNSKL